MRTITNKRWEQLYSIYKGQYSKMQQTAYKYGGKPKQQMYSLKQFKKVYVSDIESGVKTNVIRGMVSYQRGTSLTQQRSLVKQFKQQNQKDKTVKVPSVQDVMYNSKYSSAQFLKDRQNELAQDGTDSTQISKIIGQEFFGSE